MQAPKRVSQHNKSHPSIDDILKLNISLYEKNLLIENFSLVSFSKYKKILKGFPVEYVINKSIFCNHHFYIDQNVLIPRSETEQIIEIVESIVKPKHNYTFVDIGTGSGAIIISLAQQLSKIRTQNLDNFIGTDNSAKAIQIAKRNHQKISKNVRIKFYTGSLLHSPIRKIIVNKFPNNKLIIVANLPYLTVSKLKNIDSQTYKFEPHSALFSNLDGTEHYKKLFSQLKRHKITPHAIIFEIDAEEPHKFLNLSKLFFPNQIISIIKDHRGKNRFITIY